MTTESLTPLQQAQSAIAEVGFVLTGTTDLTEVPEGYSSFSQGYSGVANHATYQQGRSHKYLTVVEGHGIFTSRYETSEEMDVRLAARRARWVAEGLVAA